MLRALRELVFSFAFLAAVLPALIWLAIFTYISMYYSYIPVLHFKQALNLLKITHHCGRNVEDVSCGLLSSKVLLMEGSLHPGVDYSIHLEFELPESQTNSQIGMFEVEVELRSRSGDLITMSRRSTMLEYKSWLHKNLETVILLPLYLFTSRKQMQTLNVLMADDFKEDTYRRSYDAVVRVHSNEVEIYSSSIQVFAKFSGIRYFMYFWPLTTATVGISTLFGFLSLVVLVSCLTHFRHRSKNQIATVPQAIALEGEVGN